MSAPASESTANSVVERREGGRERWGETDRGTKDGYSSYKKSARGGVGMLYRLCIREITAYI